MQFLDTITIYHHNSDGSYSKKIVEGVFWYGSNTISPNNSGITNQDSISVFFPKKLMDIEVYKGDKIIRAVGEDITTVNTLSKYQDYITVLSIQKLITGSDIDNMLVTGK